jgi:peptidoglycan/xylan/chitin deacetylase (PgdA/CDA1 family)
MVRGIDLLRRTARRLRHRFKRKVLILLYHRVGESDTDPWALSVTPRHFTEHLEVLRQHVRPMQLQQLAQTLRDDTLPQRSTVVTFDDGYADNLHYAKPALERYDIPATVFLTTGSIGSECEFWWDELDRLLLQSGTLPATLRLNLSDSIYSFELGEAAHCSGADFRHWRAWEDAPDIRHALYRSLWDRLHALPAVEQRKLLGALRKWAGAEPVCRPTHRPLTLAEVFALAKGGLIEVGAHTVTHPSLAALPAALQQDEIQRSKAQLEQILDGPVTSFAYPHGSRRDYTSETVALVREAGFACACASKAGTVGRLTDPFQLPRVQVQDWDAEEFARRLKRWFDG